ncbi:F-box domain-containing protein [Lentithecium fluviatile CBS 122367]|uniref:F-box domain-containing protein n=1 Tax=Lentithecium fluviatile CBS 122367 TaxID=1168545 RepID=A0A6G1IK35_9PLEO|nr:F-box domain-containing protein [Lentithecium fluviatile CBS 122367]
MTSTPLLRLPLELLMDIIGRLDLQDKVRLGMTNRYLRSIIEPPTHEQLLQAENCKWATDKQLFTCKRCVGFRHLRHFADDMRKGKRARRGPEASTRLCIKCGVEEGWYSEGMEITVLGERAVLVRHCRTLTDHNQTKAACGSFGVVWTSVQSATPQQHPNGPQHSEDDWAHSARYFVQGRHAEEMYGFWADL